MRRGTGPGSRGTTRRCGGAPSLWSRTPSRRRSTRATAPRRLWKTRPGSRFAPPVEVLVVAGDIARHHGEAPDAQPDLAELGIGAALTPTGRVSIARRVVPGGLRMPFTSAQLTRIDEALTLASRTSGLRFTVYLG